MSIPIKLAPLPLWTDRWDEAALRERHRRNPRQFARGFFMQAMVDGENTFPSFEKCRQPGLVLGDLIRNSWPCFTGVDLSSTKRPGNAIVTVKLDPIQKRRFPVDIRFGRWRSNELCEAIQQVNNQFHPAVIMVENNGYQESLIDWVGDQKNRFDFWMKVEPTTTTSGTKAHADIGLPGLEVEFAHGAWSIPYSEYEHLTGGEGIGATNEDEDEEDGAPGTLHSDWRARQWARWDYEFRHHPMAATNDGVMATWFARQGIELYSGYLQPG
jgi:hypothetical protein